MNFIVASQAPTRPIICTNQSIQLLCHVQLFVIQWTAAHQAPLCFTVSQSLPRFMSTELVMISNYLILCHPLLLLPRIFPNIGIFSNESVFRIMWPKYWCFSFSISPSNQYSGLISFRIDWFDAFGEQEGQQNCQVGKSGGQSSSR